MAAMANPDRANLAAEEDRLESTDDKRKKSSFSVKDILDLPGEAGQKKDEGSLEAAEEDGTEVVEVDEQVATSKVHKEPNSGSNNGTPTPLDRQSDTPTNGASAPTFNGMPSDFPHPLELRRFGKLKT